MLNFEKRSYAVNIKYDPEIPVIRITYPEAYQYPMLINYVFPIRIIVETEDISATSKLSHTDLLKYLTTCVVIYLLLFLLHIYV